MHERVGRGIEEREQSRITLKIVELRGDHHARGDQEKKREKRLKGNEKVSGLISPDFCRRKAWDQEEERKGSGRANRMLKSLFKGGGLAPTLVLGKD